MKNPENIYELLNHMDFNLDDYKREELSDIEKQKLKNNFKIVRNKKRNFKKTGMIVAALALTIAIGSQTNLNSSIYAATKSKVLEISYSIGKALNIEKDIEPYYNVVNQTVESNGIEVKLTEVIIDKDELIFSTIADIGMPVDGARFDHDIFINGKRLIMSGASGTSKKIDGSETMFVDTYSIDAKNIELKEEMDIKIVLKGFNYYLIEDLENERIKGKWEFEFRANGKELMADSNVLPLDYSFDIEKQKYVLEEFRYNPVNQKIYGIIEGERGRAYDIDLRGYDNLGNEVEFFLSRVSGKELVFKYHGGKNDNDLADEATFITLAPYAVEFPEKSGKMSNDHKQVGEEFTIFLE